MVNSIARQRVCDQIHFLRGQPQLPFADLLDADTVAAAVAAEGGHGRQRIFTPLVTLWTFLSQILSPDHSCRDAISRLIAYLTALGQRTCAPATDAYCRARQRLPVGVVQRLARHSADTLQAAVLDSWRWKGRSVYLVDGTTVSMPDTPDNQSAFPQPRTQKPGCGFPIARLVAIISLATGAIRDLALGPYKGKDSGETALLRRLWDSFHASDLVLADRYFASFFGLAGLVRRGVDALTRMHQRRHVDFRRGRRLGVTDHIVTWNKPPRPDWMDPATYDTMPDQLSVRELKIRIDIPGFRIDELVLATTVLDAVAYGKDELAALYQERWHIELDLRSIKVVMQMDVLRCKSAAMVEKEVWMHALAYNLIRGLMAAAAAEHGTDPRRLSFKATLQALLAFRERLTQATVDGRRALLREFLNAIAAHPVGDRPGRVEPRKVKRRPKPISLLTEPRAKARKRLTRNR